MLSGLPGWTADGVLTLHIAVCRIAAHPALPSQAPACCPPTLLQLLYLLTLPGLPSTPSLHSNIAFLGSGLLVANYVGAIAAALRFPALFNIWTMGAGHAVLAVRLRGAGCWVVGRSGA